MVAQLLALPALALFVGGGILTTAYAVEQETTGISTMTCWSPAGSSRSWLSDSP
jgi:hypothetical protein